MDYVDVPVPSDKLQETAIALLAAAEDPLQVRTTSDGFRVPYKVARDAGLVKELYDDEEYVSPDLTDVGNPDPAALQQAPVADAPSELTERTPIEEEVPGVEQATEVRVSNEAVAAAASLPGVNDTDLQHVPSTLGAATTTTPGELDGSSVDGLEVDGSDADPVRADAAMPAEVLDVPGKPETVVPAPGTEEVAVADAAPGAADDAEATPAPAKRSRKVTAES